MQTMIPRPPRLDKRGQMRSGARAYAQPARRRGRHIATVAIARRLLARCFHILTQLEAQYASEKADMNRARSRFRMSLQHGRPA